MKSFRRISNIKQTFNLNIFLFPHPLQVQEKVILCIDKIYEKLDKTDISDEVLPILAKCNLANPTVLMSVTSKYTDRLASCNKILVGFKRSITMVIGLGSNLDHLSFII